MSASPALSVVLATRGDRRSIARALTHIRAQTSRAALELIVVAPASTELALGADDTRGLGSHDVLCIEDLRTKGRANAAGLARARAEVVAFVEDHSFPEPDWAETLIARHREPWASVGPLVRNGNPATLVSWCDLLLNYGPWLEPEAAGRVEELPGHNTSYKRASLRPYSDRLAEWLEVENEMHRDMARRGAALLFEPRARIEHVNVSRAGVWLAALFHAGRVYGAERCRAWSGPRGLVYAIGAPAIPLLRLVRRLAGWPSGVVGIPARARAAPLLLVGLLADAAGRAMGYAAGVGSAREHAARFELDRRSGVRAADASALEPPIDDTTSSAESP